ncbi:MAG: NAD(P)/FAD-dependent oxidoreductase [Planctomycetota bacterium]
MKSSYDVVAIGGGPAGSSTAAICAQGGLDTLLIEREAMPRFHVGESLMPETYWPLQRLGLTDRIQRAGWQAKKSVQFVTHDGRESDPFFFREHDDRPCSTTWQVERSEFDQMVFDRAAELGADTFDQTRLIDVRFGADGQAAGVVVKDAAGDLREIDCTVVVDATGQQSFLGNKLGIKEINPDLRKAAIWTYYRGAVRGEGDNNGATIILQTANKDSWFWFIPLSRGITSVGCVGDNDYLLKGRGTPADVYQQELAECPGLIPRLADATQVGDVKVAKEFSYMTTQNAGDGWVLVGDALGFIDPVYSSGVYFALDMGVRAGDAIVEGFQKQDLSAKQLSGWCEDFKEGAKWVRKLVHAFYTKEFSIGRFMKEYPEHRGNVTDLLIGRVFHENAGKMFEDMDQCIARAKAM